MGQARPGLNVPVTWERHYAVRVTNVETGCCHVIDYHEDRKGAKKAMGGVTSRQQGRSREEVVSRLVGYTPWEAG